jgi:hypothetical protein
MSGKTPRHGRAPARAGDIAARLRDEAGRSSATLRAVDGLRRYPNGERLHAIVQRCDIDREMHKVVAADLGLSRRQFYRDLATARRLIDEGLREKAAPAASAGDQGPFGSQLETAVALAAAGHGKAAFRYFAPAVASLAGDEAAWGHSVLAEFLLEDGDLPGAGSQLRRALAACVRERGPGMAHALLIEANVSSETGRAVEAVRLLQQCVDYVEPHANARDWLAVDTFSRALTLLAFWFHARGEFKAAATVHARNPAASSHSLVSPMAQIDYLNVNAMLACDSVDGPSGAKAACDAFHDFATGHGFLEEISAALLQLGGIARFERRLVDAERFAQESLAIHRTIGRPAAPILSMLTGIAVDRGASSHAVALARDMRAEAAPDSHAWWGSHLYEAEALAQAGQHREARSICSRVAFEARSRDTRIAAWLRRVEATTFGGLGDSGAAYRAAGNAVEILGEAAPPFHRIKSLMVAQGIRPTHSRGRQIRELANVLGWRQSGDGRPEELPITGSH